MDRSKVALAVTGGRLLLSDFMTSAKLPENISYNATVLLGENHGPNAVEAVLHALASCLSVGIVYNASALGIEISSLNFELEGEIDLHAFLGLSEQTRPGYKNIVVKVHANTSASKEQFEELFTYVKKTSPVLDIISNPTSVKVEVAG